MGLHMWLRSHEAGQVPHKLIGNRGSTPNRGPQKVLNSVEINRAEKMLQDQRLGRACQAKCSHFRHYRTGEVY